MAPSRLIRLTSVCWMRLWKWAILHPCKAAGLESGDPASLCAPAFPQLVWLIARDSYHVGASGLIYGIAAFLISIGFFRKDMKSIIISIITIVSYGGMVYGLFPVDAGVSFEGHLMGAVVGLFCAYLFKDKKPTDPET
ncbi:MAG: rhomboid family intramembrane serine protease [Bacteroidota bacterium]